MTNPGEMPPHDQLRDLGQRLDRTLAGRNRTTPAKDTREGSAAGLAARVLTELFVAVGVCMGLGWFADRYFGTKPWIMLVLTALGLVVGVVNVVRLGQSQEAENLVGGSGKNLPSVKDDDDEE